MSGFLREWSLEAGRARSPGVHERTRPGGEARWSVTGCPTSALPARRPRSALSLGARAARNASSCTVSVGRITAVPAARASCRPAHHVSRVGRPHSRGGIDARTRALRCRTARAVRRTRRLVSWRAAFLPTGGNHAAGSPIRRSTPSQSHDDVVEPEDALGVGEEARHRSASRSWDEAPRAARERRRDGRRPVRRRLLARLAGGLAARSRTRISTMAINLTLAGGGVPAPPDPRPQTSEGQAFPQKRFGRCSARWRRMEGILEEFLRSRVGVQRSTAPGGILATGGGGPRVLPRLETEKVRLHALLPPAPPGHDRRARPAAGAGQSRGERSAGDAMVVVS